VGQTWSASDRQKIGRAIDDAVKQAYKDGLQTLTADQVSQFLNKNGVPCTPDEIKSLTGLASGGLDIWQKAAIIRNNPNSPDNVLRALDLGNSIKSFVTTYYGEGGAMVMFLPSLGGWLHWVAVWLCIWAIWRI